LSSKKIAFLGPEGTFAQEALLSCISAKKGDFVSCSTVKDVIHLVDKGEVAQGIVPIENSIEGTVNETLDTLTFETKKVVIEREIVIPIVHHLIARDGLKLKEIKTVISHPQATAQCRNYLARELPGATILAANSTAEAVKRVAEETGPLAAIGTKLAAEIYRLKILAEDIGDFKDNQTRFLLLGRKPIPRTGNDKTSVVCFIYENRPGSLLQILQEFAFRFINLTKIQSRPTKKALGEYCFWIDMEGHLEDEQIAEALKCLRCKLRDLKVLGSYPRGT